MNIINTRYGKLLTPGPDDLIGASLITYGEWAQNEIWLLEKLISSGNTVLDIGAYIGTHTLAFSEFVGPKGRVHSFEPQPKAFFALEQCIAENGLENVSLHQLAVGERNAALKASNTINTEHNAGSFSLMDAAEAEENETAITIRTIDSLNLDACDFIKADVEGMEISVLSGARQTILKFRPLIACECNFLEASTPVLNWARTNGYTVLGFMFDAFNPHNVLGQPHNIYGSAGEVTLILFPSEQADELTAFINNSQATKISSIDDLALMLFRKPQYIAEAKNHLTPAPHTDEKILFDDPEPNLRVSPSADIQASRKLHVIVPFYKNAQLVRPLFKSLIACSDELMKHGAKLFFFNDSPDDCDLRRELEKCLRDRRSLDITVIENAENLGFVGTVNKAFEIANHKHHDVVLLNSDTYVFPRTFQELIDVAYSDHMIGFVSPRSNNATICTLPHDSELDDLSPEESFARFQQVSKHLPKMTYTPTVVGFCMLIKWVIISEFGGFDTAYGKGYNEENDLIMRANKFGYRTALANHAFVWHQGEQSFGSLPMNRSDRERDNAKLLYSRYPEYPLLIARYFLSPEYRAEKLLGSLQVNNLTPLRIGFDFTHFGTYHNGTFEAGKRLLFSAAKCWPRDIEITAFMSEEAWDFHQIFLCDRIRWADTHSPNEKVAAIVRMGQPYDADSIRRMLARAPVVSIFMLDTISSDCGYLKIEFDETLWHFALRWFDVIFTNSDFTAGQFRRRYAVGDNALIHTSYHSITPREYIDNGLKQSSIAGKNSGQSNHVMIIGNKFAHKALTPTIRKLTEAIPDIKVIALGCPDLGLANTNCIPSGTLTDHELDSLYEQTDAVIFPSHYEGFGFPILHALAHRKPIYVRRLPVFEEICSKLVQGQENIIWFETTQDLIEKIANSGIQMWSGVEAIGEINGWDRSANEVLDVLKLKINSSSQQHIAERLRWFDLAFNLPSNVEPKYRSQTELATHFATMKFSQFVTAALSNRLLFVLARTCWRMLSVAKGNGVRKKS
jgi:FkbM family methyltransferase